MASSRRVSRLSLVAGYAAPPGPEPVAPEPERHVEVDRPGELVGFDCFHIGRLSGTTGRVWQYTAIDHATSFVWAELHTTPLNPAARHASQLARRVAADLAAHGWRLERVLTDIQSGCAFASPGGRPAVEGCGGPAPVHHRSVTDRSARRLLAC
jgi:hypothetical protein